LWFVRRMQFFQQQLDRLHRALNHDFCPWANRWVYWLKHPLASVGLACVVAAACGLFVNPYAFVLLGVLVGVTLLGVFWPLAAVRGLRCEAEFLSSRCRAGEAVTVRLRIRNRWPWPTWGLSMRQGFADPDDPSSGISFARIGGWTETEFEWTFRPHRRGVFPIGTAQIDTGFPFGLVHARTVVSMRNQLIVWPRSITLDAMPDAVEIHSREESFAERRVGDCGDILGTRPFRQGDSLRRVHWGQTARCGRLVVAERQAPAMCAVLLQVDVDLESHRVDASTSTLETTLSTAASILESLHRQHAYVEVRLGDSRHPVGPSFNQLRQVLDAMARIPVTGEPHASGECLFDHPSRMLTTINVTTNVAFSRHMEHQHGRSGQRYVVVRSPSDNGTKHLPVVDGCDCRAWVELETDKSWESSLSRQWREACHVA
jgi:uncharacterized protein (DUF58 family)